MKDTKGLRFAPIIRVSTEKQEERGYSLDFQREQILKAVEYLGGTIPDYCWRYCGQEHATPGQERAKFDQLLEDAGKDLFDAVIVADITRWSRDNYRSKQAVKILTENKIRFFHQTTELDLSNPTHLYMLGMTVETGEFFASLMRKESRKGTIASAKEGNPAAGKKPYGRRFVWDRKRGKGRRGHWEIIPEKQEQIKWAAEQYLAGESLGKIAKILGMNRSNLTKILRDRCGDRYEIHFKDVDEKVVIKVPRLLPEETIEAIRARLESNKTFTHGHIKHKYLLARMIFCGHCGYTLFGQVNHNGKRYYRHARDRKTSCDRFNSIPADLIDDAVLAHIFKMLGNKAAMEQAIQDAIPNKEEVEKLWDRKGLLEKKLSEKEKERDRVVSAIKKGIITDDEAKKVMEELREEEELLKSELSAIDEKLNSVPDKEVVSRKAALMKRVIQSYYGSPQRLLEMSFEEKRKLLQAVFDGKTPEGKRYGVYIRKRDNEKHPWEFEIIGNFVKIEDFLPMSEDEKAAILGVPEREKLDKYEPEEHEPEIHGSKRGNPKKTRPKAYRPYRPRGYKLNMFDIAKHQALLNTTFLDALFHLGRNIDKSTPSGYVKP